MTIPYVLANDFHLKCELSPLFNSHIGIDIKVIISSGPGVFCRLPGGGSRSPLGGHNLIDAMTKPDAILSNLLTEFLYLS